MKTNNIHNHFIKPGAAWPLLLCVLTALLTSSARAQVIYTPVFSNIWVVAAPAFPDLPSSGNNVRGAAISPVTTNVVFASTAGNTNGGSGHSATLSFASGSNYLGQANGTGVSGGSVGLGPIRVAADGAVYTCNVAAAPASNFRLYRWASDTDFTTAPTVVFQTGVGLSFQWRAGDYMDLRGGGIDTEIVVVGNGSGANITTNFLIFRPTDASCTVFTNCSITIPAGLLNVCGGGVSFEGTNNALWVRQSGNQATRRVAFNPANLTATITASMNLDQSANGGIKYYTANGVQLLASVTTSTSAGGASPNHCARVYQITGPSNNVSVLTAVLPTTFAGGNATGLVDAQNDYFIFGEANNGLAFYKLGFITNSPPSVSITSSGGALIEGFNYTFSANASGSTPLTYQWYYNASNKITGAITNTYSLTPVQLTNGGTYSLVVTNLYGSTTSSVSTISVLPNGSSLLTTQLWSKAPGSFDFLANDNNQRGIAYDPVNSRVVLVSRTPTNGVHILDAQTGADQGDLDITAILPGGIANPPAGTFALNMVGVADDGAVYVCNLITSGASDFFMIYRWQSATNTEPMSIAYGPANPGLGRLGDTMAVRGSGTSTEILCSFRTGTNVALFTTVDGTSFNYTALTVTNLPADAQANGFAGLGIAFGPGNTYWAKSAGFNLRQLDFDATSGNSGVINTYSTLPGTEAPLGVDNASGLLAVTSTSENPANLALYNLHNGLALADREFFPANNSNGNGTGAAAFDVAGGRLFALNSNSGLIALVYAGGVNVTGNADQQIVTWPVTAATLQSASNVMGPYTDLTGATSPYTNTTGDLKFFRTRR